MAISNTLQFYLDRAEEARKQAEAATLSRVRERCRRSEIAWQQLAEKAALTEKLRLQQQLFKAGELAN
jgi:hypothetical protein